MLAWGGGRTRLMMFPTCSSLSLAAPPLSRFLCTRLCLRPIHFLLLYLYADLYQIVFIMQVSTSACITIRPRTRARMLLASAYICPSSTPTPNPPTPCSTSTSFSLTTSTLLYIHTVSTPAPPSPCTKRSPKRVASLPLADDSHISDVHYLCASRSPLRWRVEMDCVGCEQGEQDGMWRRARVEERLGAALRRPSLRLLDFDCAARTVRT
ncbi:hypothetical protein C8R45DRAFT_1220575 [Mycena sanguinolenta]|nr:hypothetical protein C8R45DRAFT_1220575 [Mycena sanguinolenta]